MKRSIIFSVRHDDKILFIGTTCTKFEFPTYKQVYWNIPPNVNKLASANSDDIEIRIEKQCPLEYSIEQREMLRKEIEQTLLKKIKTKQEINKTYYKKARQNKITCECGSVVISTTIKQHLKTKKHINFHNAYHSCEE